MSHYHHHHSGVWFPQMSKKHEKFDFLILAYLAQLVLFNKFLTFADINIEVLMKKMKIEQLGNLDKKALNVMLYHAYFNNKLFFLECSG
jgi:hypothetical protein